MKTTYISFSFFIVISVVIYCCNGDIGDTSAPPVCDQKCKDDYTAYAVSDIFTRTWNTNIRGRYVTNYDTTVSGPNGGTIRIQGFIVVFGDTSEVNLDFIMSDCKSEDYAYSLTFTEGKIKVEGEHSTSHKNLTYRSNDIKFYGTVALNQAQSVVLFEQSCEMSILERTPNRNGTICNRAFP